MKISIITAVYNNKINLKDAIDSVNDQTHKDIEHIIVDGNSTDGTLELIKQNENKISKWVSEKANGIYDALNKGIDLATGDVIGFLHSDDVYATNNIISSIAQNFENNNIDSLYGDLQYVSKTNTSKIIRFWKSKTYNFELLKRGWMPPHPTFFVKRDVYIKYGKFKTKFRIAADYDLMLRFLGQKKISTFYLPQVIVKMRLGGASNKSLKNIARKSYEDLIALRENSIGGVMTLLKKNTSKILQFVIK